MERKYVTYFNGIKIDVVEVKNDAKHQVQISVLGDPLFNKKSFKQYKDNELESQGYERLALVNGSLFFSEGQFTYANGIEKSMGITHENDDVSWDNTLGFYHNTEMLYVYTQRYIKTIINRPDVRGAITSAFGLLNNGLKDISGAKIDQPSRSIYISRSGRTIIGKKADNTMVFAVFDGVTGLSGLTGDQTVQLAIKLGLRNAVCMDGGGSTYLEYKGQVINDSSREGANAVAFYIKNKTQESGFNVGDQVKINGTFTIEKIEQDYALIKEMNTWIADRKSTRLNSSH